MAVKERECESQPSRWPKFWFLVLTGSRSFVVYPPSNRNLTDCFKFNGITPHFTGLSSKFISGEGSAKALKLSEIVNTQASPLQHINPLHRVHRYWSHVEHFLRVATLKIIRYSFRWTSNSSNHLCDTNAKPADLIFSSIDHDHVLLFFLISFLHFMPSASTLLRA